MNTSTFIILWAEKNERLTLRLGYRKFHIKGALKKWDGATNEDYKIFWFQQPLK